MQSFRLGLGVLLLATLGCASDNTGPARIADGSMLGSHVGRLVSIEGRAIDLKGPHILCGEIPVYIESEEAWNVEAFDSVVVRTGVLIERERRTLPALKNEPEDFEGGPATLRTRYWLRKQ